jgi:hypothetical protein
MERSQAITVLGDHSTHPLRRRSCTPCVLSALPPLLLTAAPSLNAVPILEETTLALSTYYEGFNLVPI